MSRRGPTAIPGPHGRCRKPNGGYSRALSQRRNGPHERGGLWKCRPVDAEENQKQVSLRAHRPWKSQTARFPHSHSPETRNSGKRKARFPLFRWLFLYFANRIRKEAWRRIAPLPPSGSFFDEKMLGLEEDSHSPQDRGGMTGNPKSIHLLPRDGYAPPQLVEEV